MNKCDNANCPANSCDHQHCMLKNLVERAPHILCEHRDSEHVCDEFKAAATPVRRYRDFQDRVLFVSTGGSVWFTAYQKPGSQGTHRIKSKFLPLRDTRELAQADLDRYAEQRCMEEALER